jgi:hypothetical protein
MSIEAVKTILDDAIIKYYKTRCNILCIRHYKNREILGSIYPEKFTFENLIGRTAKK